MRHVLLICGVLAVAFPALAKKVKVVARVNGAEITKRQLIAAMSRQMRLMRFHRRFTKEMLDKIQKAALKKLIDEELLYQEARRQRVLPSDAEIKRAKAKVVARSGGKRKLGSHLMAQHMSWADHWRLLKRQLAIHAVVDKLVIHPSRISAEQAKAHYDSNPARYKRPPMVKIREMLFMVKPKEPAKAWDRARATAKAIVTKLRLGADFDKLSRSAMHIKTSHARGRQGSEWTHKGVLIPEVDKVAFSIKAGEVSDPIRTMLGYVVIKVVDRRPEKQLSFKEVGSQLRKNMFGERVKERSEALMKRLKSKAKIVNLAS